MSAKKKSRGSGPSKRPPRVSNEEIAGDKRLIIGYWPLLDPASLGIQPGQEFRDPNVLMDHLRGICSVNGADACLWTADSETGEVAPVLAIPGARKIGEHLKTWSEGKPEDWFTCYFHWTDERYVIALVPNPDMSIRRYKLARAMFAEDFATAGEFVVISSPLYFAARMSDLFRGLRDRLPRDRVGVGLVEPGLLPNPPRSELVELGTFKRGNADERSLPLLERLLEFD